MKGQRFVNERVVGHALSAAKVHAARGVDELLLLDVAATAEGRQPDLGLVAELSRDVFVPLTVGGGVKSLADVDALLRVGADKVSVGHHATPDFVRAAAQRFGSQAITVSIDAYDVADCFGPHVAREVGPMPVPEYAKQMAEAGAGEILLNNMDRDGTMEGYDLDLIRAVADAVDVPVIACGGCSGYDDMAAALQAGASGVAAGALFQFTDATPRGAADHLARKGFTVRLP